MEANIIDIQTMEEHSCSPPPAKQASFPAAFITDVERIREKTAETLHSEVESSWTPPDVKSAQS